MMKSNAELDCLGLYCPMPIAKTVEKMKDLKPGEVLEILADDEGIKSDMPAWCQATGNELLAIEEENDKFRIFIRKKGG